MALVVDCPSCTRKLRLPADLLGRMVRCASCGGTFEAKESPAATPPPASAPELPLPDRPSGRSRSRHDDSNFDDTEPCPRCGEEIPVVSARCEHCGERLELVEDRPWERGVRRDCEPHRGGLLLTLGVISIVCGALGIAMFCCAPLSGLFVVGGVACAIPAWVMGHRDLANMRTGAMDPRGRGTTQGGWICAIIGTVLNCIGLLVALAMVGLMVYSSATAPPTVTPAPPAAAPAPAPPGRGRRIDFDPGWRHAAPLWPAPGRCY
jgi:hypothetical protein